MSADTIHPAGSHGGARRPVTTAIPLLVLALLAALVAVTAPVAPAAAADERLPIAAVNFQSSGARVPVGYVRDFGQSFDPARGFGWTDDAGDPLSLVGHGRDRGVTDDQVLDTVLRARTTRGADGTFEYVVDPGRYEVSVTVGDATPDAAGVQSAAVEGITALTGFTPSADEPHRTETVVVEVLDGAVSVASIGDALSVNAVEIVQIGGASAAADPNCADADTFLERVNFTTSGGPLPAGYVRDHGRAFQEVRGRGWQRADTGASLSVVGNGRVRDSVSDIKSDSFVHMQYRGSDGVETEARWAKRVEVNGWYEVALAVGDPLVYNSRHTVNVEGVPAIRNFAPTPQLRSAETTVCVNVSDGELTIDADGGDNTKLLWVRIKTARGDFVNPTPALFATGVSVCTNITATTTRNLDGSSMSTSTFRVTKDGTGAVVDGNYNTDAAGGVASFQPVNPSDPDLPALDPNSTYRVQLTDELLDRNGVPFRPLGFQFQTNGPVESCSSISFDRVDLDDLVGPTGVTFGPDGKLYVSTFYGELHRYSINSGTGVTTKEASWYPFGENNKTIIGMAFEPGSTNNDLRLWVSANVFGINNNSIPADSGQVRLLSGTTSTNLVPVSGAGIDKLPRSVRDHMTNSLEFGPDGRLYVSQGSNSGYGAPDPGWNNQAERPLSAAILVADVVNDSAFRGGGLYNSLTNPGNKITRFASGVRNPYDLTWTNDGRLFSGVNQAARGDVPDPAGSGNVACEYAGVGPGDDYATEILEGKYYGHPNPSIGKYVLNGGNPTSGVDPYEFTGFPVDDPPDSGQGCAPFTPTGYAVGQAPDPDWEAPSVNLGRHRSPNGIDEYDSDVFGPAFEGWIVLAEFSGGDRVIAFDPDDESIDVDDAMEDGFAVFAAGFNNPLDLRVDGATGRIYVTEFGSEEQGGADGKLTLLVPAPDTTLEEVAQVNFGCEPGTLPGDSGEPDCTTSDGVNPPPNQPNPGMPDVEGYVTDWGRGYGAKEPSRTYGWVDPTTRNPKSIVGEGRYRFEAFANERNPLQSTLIHMQGGPGNPDPAEWEYALPNGEYQISVSVGESGNSLNSTHYLEVEGVVAVPAYTPTTVKDLRIETLRVTVTDGRLTLRATPNGDNAKINWVTIHEVIEA